MQNMLATLDAFWNKVSVYMNLPKITTTDIVEIIIIAFLFYYMLLWIKNTRAWVLLRGLMVILLFVLLAAVFQMNTIIWIAKNTLNILLIALVIIFQPEMRKALENLGRKNILASLLPFDFSKGETAKFSDRTITEMAKACYEMGKVKTGALIVVEDNIVLSEYERTGDRTITEMAKACYEMGKVKTGALIVVEDNIVLSEYERTGIAVDGVVSSQLLINIFEKNTPLHDGAVIVRGDRIVAATCYLPLTDSLTISKDLGTRHRAAVGISEVSDSLTIVVSEETGRVSIALGGELYRNVDADFLKNKLAYLQHRKKLAYLQHRKQQASKIELLKRRLKHVKEAR